MSQSYHCSPPHGGQFDCREAAERAIEIYAGAGPLYEVVEVRSPVRETIFAVKAYAADGRGFLGYCQFEEPSDETL